eukprot:350306-Chlamydomonas_euryale.AAC.3
MPGVTADVSPAGRQPAVAYVQGVGGAAVLSSGGSDGDGRPHLWARRRRQVWLRPPAGAPALSGRRRALQALALGRRGVGQAPHTAWLHGCGHIGPTGHKLGLSFRAFDAKRRRVPAGLRANVERWCDQSCMPTFMHECLRLKVKIRETGRGRTRWKRQISEEAPPPPVGVFLDGGVVGERTPDQGREKAWGRHEMGRDRTVMRSKSRWPHTPREYARMGGDIPVARAAMRSL